jgi:mono/diheme cytochrome c family protein
MPAHPSCGTFSRDLIVALLIGLQAVSPPEPQSSITSTDGRALYSAACAACHGSDGKGQPRHVVGFDTPLPDFTDCSFSTPEPDADWFAIVHQGGPVRAFDRRMPAFGDVLSAEAIRKTLDYARSFCRSRSWPRGELNLPRALVTEKAFPENEAVVTATVSGGEESSVVSEFLYEQRLGPRSQFEIAVPLAFQNTADSTWHRGLGDVAVAFKHTLIHSLDAGTIVSGAAEVVWPTGKETEGLGNGVTVFEPFVAVGQILAADAFLQFQVGAELSANRSVAPNEFFWRGLIGKSFMPQRFGRTWSPLVEILGARELGTDARVEWDVVPQMQVTLSRRQHIMLNGGVRIPVTERNGRDTQVLIYLLWDWFDGGFFDGWH